MTAQIKVKVQRKAIVKLKVLPRFPVNVVANPGLLIARSGVTYTFSLDPAYAPSVLGLVIGTNVQAYDADLQALANNSGTGIWTVTGAGTGSVRTITGTANEITLTNGSGVAGNPTASLPAALTFTGKTITGGAFTGGTAQALTSFSIANSGFQHFIASGGTYTGNHTTTITTNNGDRNIVLGSDLTLNGAFTLGGGFNLTITPSANSSIIPPVSGTLATLAGGETFTNKTLTAPAINTPTIAGGTANALTGLSIVNNGFNFSFTSTDTLTGNKGIVLKINDTTRTIDLSGNLTLAGAVSLPAITQGDIWYGSASGIKSALAKDAVGNKFIKNSGASNNPAWAAIALTDLPTQTAFTFVGNNTSGSAIPTAVSIPGLTTKASPVAADLVMIADSAASNAWKQTTVSALASAGSVSSIAGITGAFTLSRGIGNSVNDIRLAVPYFMAYKAADQTGISNATATTLVLDTEIFDTNNWFASNTFTPLLAGTYEITCAVYGFGATTLTRSRASIFKNGTEYAQSDCNPTANAQTAIVTAFVAMNGSTDTITGSGLVIGTGALSFTGGSAPLRTFLQGKFISP